MLSGIWNWLGIKSLDQQLDSKKIVETALLVAKSMHCKSKNAFNPAHVIYSNFL